MRRILAILAVLLLAGCVYSIDVEGPFPGGRWRPIDPPREGLECWVRGAGNAVVVVCVELSAGG